MTGPERGGGASFFERPVVAVAEDDQETRRVLWSRLSAGYREREARDGIEALSRIHAARALGPGSLPAVVVTDVRMPGMSGLELLARVRALDPALRVILITAFGDPETHAEAKPEVGVLGASVLACRGGLLVLSELR